MRDGPGTALSCATTAILAAALLAGGGPAGAATEEGERLDWVIESALARPGFNGLAIGVVVEDLGTGEILYERNADSLFVPASNMKIVTAAAALRVLGPDYSFETDILLDAADAGPRTGGDLYVRGSGDPSFVSEELWKLVEEIRLAGIEEIGGDIVLDATCFDSASAASPDVLEGDRAYHARTGALSLNFNTIAVRVGPGARPGLPARVALAPRTGFVEVRNGATTASRRSSKEVSVRRAVEGGSNVIEVTGAVPAGSRPRTFYRSLDDPAGYFGTVLAESLEREGIAFGGVVRSGVVPADTRAIVVHRSKPLSLIVRDLGKFSNNFVAEQLAKAIGAVTDGRPGTTAAGLREFERFLASLGLDAPGTRIEDGSGFSRGNRLSPRTIAGVIRAMHEDFETAYEFFGSFSVSGTDGTLEDRMKTGPLPGRVRAKTGLLDGVTAVSGVMETAAGRRLVFSIITNGSRCEAWRVHDLEHGLLLAIHGL